MTNISASLVGAWAKTQDATKRGELTMELNRIDHLAMDQYLYIPFLGGWTSIYQLF